MHDRAGQKLLLQHFKISWINMCARFYCNLYIGKGLGFISQGIPRIGA